MTGRLAGKVALVMGAGSRGEGIGNGKAAAVLFAREGAHVVCVDTQTARAQETVDMISAEGFTASVAEGDASRRDECHRLAAAGFGARHHVLLAGHRSEGQRAGARPDSLALSAEILLTSPSVSGKRTPGS